jgi:FkbM family methyltransferase
MKQIFINIGAGSGSDIRGFVDLNPDYANWDLFAFECNPSLIEKIRSDYPFVNVQPYAASTENGISKLFLGNSYINSSLISNKINVYEDKFLEVNTIDISKWIIDNFSKNDYIILTLDIEGKEYEVLEKMMEDKSLDLIDELYVEFHGKKIPGITSEYEKSIVDYLIGRFGDKVYIYEYHNNEKFIELNKEAVI